ncbi:hypothetical protein RTBOTA2_002435 [Rhodotorula toruloides]|nr:hypothetical protein RTBOTA2_002435 [Rhodotorula toruloides]
MTDPSTSPQPLPTYAATPSPRELLRDDSLATVHSWTQHLRVPPVTVASSDAAVPLCDTSSIEAVAHPSDIGIEPPVGIIFVPDLANRLSRHADGLFSSSSLADVPLLSLQTDDDADEDRLSQLYYVAMSLNDATTNPVQASTPEAYTRGLFSTVKRACAEPGALFLLRTFKSDMSVSSTFVSTADLYVDGTMRALLELKKGNSTRLGDPTTRGSAAVDGLIRSVHTHLSQLATDGVFISWLCGFPGGPYAGPKGFLLHRALPLPQCLFLAALDWTFILPMYILPLHSTEHLSALPPAAPTIVRVTDQSPPRRKPPTSYSTPSTPSSPYTLAIGELVPISGSFAADGHSLPHILIGGAASDAVSADLLRLIQTDPRYQSLAHDLRNYRLRQRETCDSPASTAPPATSAMPGTQPLPQTATASDDMQAHDKQSPGDPLEPEEHVGETDETAEPSYRSVSMQELQTLPSLKIAYMYSNGLLDDFFTATSFTTSPLASTLRTNSGQQPVPATSHTATSISTLSTPAESGLPVLALEFNPLDGGRDGVVHRVVGFDNAPLVAKFSHADRVEEAENELAVYRTIQDVPQLFRALRGSQYLDWTTIILVMEDGGSHLRSWTDLTVDERPQLYNNLQDLHRIYHGFIKPSNVLRSSAGQLRFIDFATAFIHDCEGDDCYELQRFREILEL